MSKLCRENRGKTFTVEANGVDVKYRIIDTSFDHEFGKKEQYNYEIVSVIATDVFNGLTIEEAIEKDLDK